VQLHAQHALRDLSRWEQAAAEADFGHLFVQAFPISYLAFAKGISLFYRSDRCILGVD